MQDLKAPVRTKIVMILHHKCSKAAVVPCSTAQLHIPSLRALRRHHGFPPPAPFRGVLPALKACIFLEYQGFHFCGCVCKSRMLCVYCTGLCPCKQAPLVFKLDRPSSRSVLSPFICVSLFYYSKVLQREDEKKLGSLLLQKHEFIFKSLKLFTLYAFFNGRWICLWLVLFPKVALGMKGINYKPSKCSWL